MWSLLDALAPLNWCSFGAAYCCWSDETVGWSLLSLHLRIWGTIRRDCCYFSWPGGFPQLRDEASFLTIFAQKGPHRKSASSWQIRMSFGTSASNLERRQQCPQKTQNSCFASCTKAAFLSKSAVFRLSHVGDGGVWSFLSKATVPIVSLWKSCSRPLKRSSSAFRHTFGASHHLLREIRAAWAPHFWPPFNGIKLFMMPTEFYPNLTATFILVAPWSLSCYCYLPMVAVSDLLDEWVSVGKWKL